NTHNVAQLTADYDDTYVMADAYGIPFPELLQKLKSSGISSLGLYNLSLNNLSSNGRLSMLQRSEAAALFPQLSWGKYETLILFNADDTTLYQQVLSHLKTQTPKAFPPRPVSLGAQR